MSVLTHVEGIEGLSVGVESVVVEFHELLWISQVSPHDAGKSSVVQADGSARRGGI